MYLNPDSMKSQSNAAIKVLKSDEKGLDKTLKSIDAFVNDKEIESEAFNSLKVHMADYRLVVQALKKAATADKEDHEKLKGVMDGIDGIIDGGKLNTAIEDAQERKKRYEDMQSDFPAPTNFYLTMISDCERIIDEAKRKKEQYRDANRTTGSYFTQGKSIRTNTDMAITSLGAASYSVSVDSDGNTNIVVTGVDKSKWHSGLMSATVVDTARELSDVSIEDMTDMQQMRMGQMTAYLVDDADAETMQAVSLCYYDLVLPKGDKPRKYVRKETAIELKAAIDLYAQGRAFYNGGLDEKRKQRHIVMLTALSEEELLTPMQIASNKNENEYDITLVGTTIRREYHIDREAAPIAMRKKLDQDMDENVEGILKDLREDDVTDMVSNVGKVALMIGLPELGIGTEIATEAFCLVPNEAYELDKSKKTEKLINLNNDNDDADYTIQCLGGRAMWTVDGRGGYEIRMYPSEVTEAAIDEANELIKTNNEHRKKPTPLIDKRDLMKNYPYVDKLLEDGLTKDQLNDLADKYGY